MLNKGKSRLLILGAVGFALCVFLTPAFAQKESAAVAAAQPGAENVLSVPSGSAMEVGGYIAGKENRSLTLNAKSGSKLVVLVTDMTQIREKKSNPFRTARRYTEDMLLRGLNIEVKGHGNGSGALVADEIRFTKDDLWVAQTVQNRVRPVESRLEAAEVRLGQSEQNAQHLSGQVDELMAVSNAARGGAKAAQETADAAQAAAKTAHERADSAHERADSAHAGVRATNDRIGSLDDFEVQQSIVVNFKAGSAVLSPEGKASLDGLATAAKATKGYVIEVTGYASADGNDAFNRQLSERRANAVVRYLVEQNQISLRRITTPFGFGEKLPVADNSTREGRTQNRRVEVRILASKGIADKAPVTTAMQQ